MSFLSELFDESPFASLEETKYGDLFRDVTGLSAENRATIADVIRQAQETLVKSDRVIWYLRLWKIGFVHAVSGEGEAHDRVAADYARRAKIDEVDAEARGWQVYNDDDLLGELDHFLRLPIPAVRSLRFGYADPDALVGELRTLEKKWQAVSKDSFEDHDAVQVLRFANGLAWYDLKRPTCAIEAEAMGHHGNGGREGSGDTLLSLRQTFDHGGRVTHQPILTFVLDKNGFLGEMKGRYGEKPEQQYHNEIVALLRLPMIHGLKGGGPKPESNFSLTDLDEEIAHDLATDKPELNGLAGVYAKRGIREPLVTEMLFQRLNELGITPPMVSLHKDRDVFTIERWRDATSFFHAMGDGICEAAAELLNGHAETIADDGVAEADILAVITALDPRAYVGLMRVLNIRPIKPTAPQYDAALRLAVARLRGTPLEETLHASIAAARRVSGATKDALSTRLQQYVSTGWRFHNRYQHVTIGDDLTKPVAVTIRADDLVSIVTASPDDEDDFLLVQEAIQHAGWFEIDRNSMSAVRGNAGLCSEVSAHAKLAHDPVFAKLLADISVIDPVKAASLFARDAGL